MPKKDIDPEIVRLRQTHPLYEEYKGRWRFFLDAYEGGQDFANGSNLFKHVRENEEDFKDRVKRLDNCNYCEGLVDFFTAFIFGEPIDRNGGSDDAWFAEFCQDVNLKGDTVEAFMRKVSTAMQVYGMTHVMVDAPKSTVPVLTEADVKELGIRPYWVHVRPFEVTDWLRDDFNKLVYLKRRQDTVELVNGSKRYFELYTEVTPETYTVTKVDVTDAKNPVISGAKETIENPTGIVPVHTVFFKRSDKTPDIGLSFLRDLAGNQRKILNLTSMLDDFLYRQAFNILAREEDTALPMANQQEGVVGTSNTMSVPKDAKFPQYISPPIDPAKIIQDERQRVASEMFKRAAQDTVNELYNGGSSSGFSQAQSFSKTVPHISTRADILEMAEEQLMRITCMFIKGKKWQGKIKYKDRYEITNLTDALTQLLMIVGDLGMPSEIFVKEELKRTVREFDGKLPPETLTEIYKEIDEYSFDKWQKHVQSLGGKAATNQQKPKGTGTMAEAQAEANNSPVGATNKLKTV